MIVGQDLDGVVVDWFGAVLREHDLWFGTHLEGRVAQTWDEPFTLTGMGHAELFAWCDEAQVFDKALPIPGALGGIRSFIMAGHEMRFISHRPQWALRSTLHWLDRYLGGVMEIGVEAIFLTADKGSVECDVYIDDSPAVIEDLAARGRRVIRYAYPYNEAVADHAWGFAYDWGGVVSLVEEATDG